MNTQLRQQSPALWNKVTMFTYTRQWHAWSQTRECLVTWGHRRNVHPCWCRQNAEYEDCLLLHLWNCHFVNYVYMGLTNKLHPWQANISSVSQKFPAFYRRFTSMFTTTCHLISTVLTDKCKQLSLCSQYYF